MKIARITLSDRASAGLYPDLSGPEIERLLSDFFPHATPLISLLIPDDSARLSHELKRLCDDEACSLIVTTGGTGPSPRDITPEATRCILEKELPGFGEIMRTQTFHLAPTSILSRAIAGIRKKTLIINLPGNPKAIRECLSLLLPAIRECLKHLAEPDPSS
jgi:molybdopterin adenylyltransferase